MPDPTDNTTTTDPRTAMLAKWVEPHVIDWLADCDAAEWRHADNCLTLVASSATIGPAAEPPAVALRFWPQHGKIEFTEWVLDHAEGYMATAPTGCDSDPYRCPCDTCADQRAIELARRISDDPRIESL